MTLKRRSRLLFIESKHEAVTNVDLSERDFRQDLEK